MLDNRRVRGDSHGACSFSERCGWEQHRTERATGMIVLLGWCDHPGALAPPAGSTPSRSGTGTAIRLTPLAPVFVYSIPRHGFLDGSIWPICLISACFSVPRT